METDGCGWTVFQRRESGLIDFYLNWADYEEGIASNPQCKAVMPNLAEIILFNTKTHRISIL